MLWSGRTTLRAATAFIAPLIALALVAVQTTPANAAQRAAAPALVRAAQPVVEVPTPSLRDEIAVTLAEASKLIDDNNFVGALVKLFDADAIADKTPFEEYEIAKYLGLIFVNQPMPDWEAARGVYNRQVESHGCPDFEQPNMYAVAMRLNSQFTDDADVIGDARELAKLRPLSEPEVRLLAAAYFRTADFANAAAAAKAGIDAGAASGREPNLELREILMSAEAKLNQQL